MEQPEVIDQESKTEEISVETDNKSPEIVTTSEVQIQGIGSSDIPGLDEDEIPNVEEFMDDPPEVLKKENITKLQGRVLTARLMKAMLMKDDEVQNTDPYYWEDYPDEVGTKRFLYDNARYYGSSIFKSAAYVGKVASHTLGLSQPIFGDIVEQVKYEQEQEAIKNKRKEKRMKREKELAQKQISDLEAGNGETVVYSESDYSDDD